MDRIGWRSATGRDLVLIVVIAAALLIPSLQLGFVCDDWEYIDDMVDLQGPLAQFGPGSWSREIPLANLSLALDHHLYGLEPLGWHVTAGLLYVLCTVLVYLFALQTGIHRVGALAAAAIYFLHPAHDEVVFWVAARAHLVVTVAMLTALLAYGRFSRGGRLVWFALSLVATAAALLAKEYGLLLWLLVPLYDLACLGERGAKSLRSLVLRSIPYAALALGWLAARSVMLARDRVQGLTTAPLLGSRLVAYLLELALPVPFTEVSEATLLRCGELLAPVVLIAFGFGAGVYYARRGLARHPAMFAAAWTLLTLLVVASEQVSFRRRYLFVPSVGAVLLIGLLVERLRQTRPWHGRGPRVDLMLAAALSLVSLPVFLHRQQIWIGAGRAARDMVLDLANSPVMRSGERVRMFIPVLPYRYGGDDHGGAYLAQEDDLSNQLELAHGLDTETAAWIWATWAEGMTARVRYLEPARIEVRLAHATAQGFELLLAAIDAKLATSPAAISGREVDRDARVVRFEMRTSPDREVIEFVDGRLRVVARR